MVTSNYSNTPSPLSNLILGGVILSAILLATLPGGNLINIGVSALFVAVVLFGVIAGKRALWFSPELLILVAWLCYSMIGTLMSADTEVAMFKFLTMLQILVLAFCIQQAVIWSRGSSGNLIVYGIAVGISYLLTFTEFSAQEVAGAESVAGDVSRVASTLNDENTFGAVSLMGFSLVLIALAKNTKKAYVLPLSVLLVLLLLAVVNSGSRTAFLGGILVLMGSLWAFRLWRGAAMGKLLMVGMLTLLVSVAAFFTAKSIPAVADRIDAVFSEDSAILGRVEGFIDVLMSGDTKAEEGDSIDSRVEMFSDGLDIIADSPLVGIGLNNFSVVSGAGTYAHSNLIEVAASTGLIGFVIYYLMYLVLTLRIFKLINSQGAGRTVARLALIGLMAYFLMDITRVSYYEKTSWIYFAMLGAIIEVYIREKRETQAEEMPAKRRRRKRRAHKKLDAPVATGAEFDDIDAMFSKNKT